MIAGYIPDNNQLKQTSKHPDCARKKKVIGNGRKPEEKIKQEKTIEISRDFDGFCAFILKYKVIKWNIWRKAGESWHDVCFIIRQNHKNE